MRERTCAYSFSSVRCSSSSFTTLTSDYRFRRHVLTVDSAKGSPRLRRHEVGGRMVLEVEWDSNILLKLEISKRSATNNNSGKRKKKKKKKKKKTGKAGRQR